jgi:hypothetical protein
MLCSLAQAWLGGALVLLGGVLMLTLFLLPVGLPLALLGSALVAAASGAGVQERPCPGSFPSSAGLRRIPGAGQPAGLFPPGG